MDNHEIIITRKDKLDAKHINKHEPYDFLRYQVTPPGHMKQCFVAIYEILPKKSNYPFHYHIKNEEVFYIISGQGILETVSGEREVSAGDIIVCPASENGAHKLTNASSTEKLVYVDFDTANVPEAVIYPHSDKIGIMAGDGVNEFFKRNTKTTYYDGE